MKYIKQNIWTFLVFVIGVVAIFLIDANQKESDLQKRKLLLEQVHNQAIHEFSAAINKFAALVSGMRSFMNMSETLPTAIEFQLFVQNQMNDINSQDSLVVSYIDTTHTFRYSFTPTAMDPSHLVGIEVSSLRPKDEISRLNNMMNEDKLNLFPPINLVEGWVGLPIDFRVYRDGRVIGYVASLISFKTLIQDLYDTELSRDFVFQFNIDNKYDFDREIVHNNTKVYHDSRDPEYYGNFNLEPSDFIFTTVNYYGCKVKISTAYKDSNYSRNEFTLILWTGHLSLTLLFFLLNRQMITSRKLNIKLNKNNRLLDLQKEKISLRNTQLESLNKTKDKLFSIIGHDVKQPLTSIKGLLSLLEQEEIQDPDLYKIITDLEDSTRNTVNLLDNLLRWATSQTGELKFQPTKLLLNDLVKQAVDSLRYQAKDKSINLSYNSEDQIECYVDSNMMSSVIRNLVSNALKFTNEQGEIKVGTVLKEETVLFIVEDNGVGMKQEEVDNFLDFQTQISKTGTFGETGTGLGLLLCQEFIARHKGRIDVKTKLGEGTTFTVTLPLLSIGQDN